jgi:TATA-binding protein-associated factor
VSFFVHLILQHVADQEEDIRKLAAHSLAQIVWLLSLDNSDVLTLPSTLHEAKQSEAKRESMSYLVPLFDLSKAQRYAIVLEPDFSSLTARADDGREIVPTIRNYQVEGVNWLGFLHNYGLNGILADDM